MLFDPGSRASLPAEIRAGLQHQHQVTAMFSAELSCSLDDTVRVPRWPGVRPDFFDVACEQAELPGAFDHKLLGCFGMATQMLQVKDQNIPRADLLPALGNRICLDGLCRQPETERGAQYPARLEYSPHGEIIARKKSIGMSTKVCRQALDSVGLNLYSNKTSVRTLVLFHERTECNA